MITSPYNFVPLSDAVFYPDWGSKVQHDMPFRDGVSGELEIEVIATRPIYTRNHAAKPADLFPYWNDVNNIDEAFAAWASFAKNSQGEYELPGTLIHGAIRNIVKIAGCGSFRDAQNEDRYAVRDLNLDDYKDSFVKGKTHTQIDFQSKAGWLVKKDDEWTIYPCEHHRVEQECLCDAAAILTPEEKALTRDEFLQAGNDPKHPNSIEAKYHLWAVRGLPRTISYRDGEEFAQTDRHRLPLVYRHATEIGKGNSEGEIVFTGQPSPDKHMEFIFDTSASALTQKGISLKDEDGQAKRFLFAHAQSEGLDFWEDDLYEGKPVPVFYLSDGKGEVREFGLAQMFRLPAPRTLSDGIPDRHKAPDEHDLADLIFGTLHGDKPEIRMALRGRAAFSSFTVEPDKQGKPPQPMKLEWSILGEPRPSFYPNYLEQDTSTEGNQLPIIGAKRDGSPKFDQPRSLLSQSKHSKGWLILLRGWKHYATWPDWDKLEEKDRNVIPPDHTKVSPENIKSATAFAPLPAGTRFVGKLRFHNLRVVELGALIWAIEWGGDTTLRHSLGMAKGLGLGSATMKIKDRDTRRIKTFGKDELGKDEFTVQSALDAFTAAMADYWNHSPETMKELRQLATPATPDFLPNLRYPQLRIGNAGNNFDEFRQAKTTGQVLPRYSQMIALSRAVPTTQTPPAAQSQRANRGQQLNLPAARQPSRNPQVGRPASASASSLADLREGDELPGTVKAYLGNKQAAFVEFGFGDGFLHISEISHVLISDLPAALPLGTRVRVRIIRTKTSAQGRPQVDCSMKDVDQSGL